MNLACLLPALAASTVLAGASLAVAAPLPAAGNAASINAGLQAMHDYNVIALKDLHSTSDVEGRAFVGGNLSGGSANFLTRPAGPAVGAALTVGGNVTGSQKNINNGGSIQVGGNLDSGANMNGSGQVQVGGNAKKVNSGGAIYVDGNVENSNAKDIHYGGAVKTSNGTMHAGDHSAAGLQTTIEAQAAAYTDELLDTSAYLAALAPTNALTYSVDGQQAIFDAGAGTGVAVFALADLEAALKKQSQLQFSFPTTYDMVVINVAGLNVNLPGGINFNGPSNLGQKVIWNFYEAKDVNLGAKSWYGSVLAPQANLRFNNSISGSVVAKDLLQNGAIRGNTFSATAAMGEVRDAVPEPATWMMMILGFGSIGAMMPRRRAALASLI